jgi:predicted Zn-dependent protease
MKRLLSLLVVSCLLTGCVINMVTGRKQLRLVNDSELRLMATSEYNTFLSAHKVISPGSNRNAAMVKRVGERISSAIRNYYDNKGQPEILEGYVWEFNTVESEEINAWCMPGGKVVVYSGLLPVTQNETALAIVMGHEIAHAIVKHGNERMSQALLQQMGGVALDVALSQKPQETRDMFMSAYGMGSQVGAMLPWSRQQESEADQYGLIFSAMAGYNPREATAFWQRMATAGGESPPEFLSTHPSDETRLRKLQQYIPEAMKFYTGRN